MSIQGMNQTIKFNRQQKGERKTIYDRKEISRNGAYGDTEDHTKMKSHVFADFQKEQFRKRRKERARGRRLILISALIVIILLAVFLWLWNGYDFNLLKSPVLK